ncbi:MULTISPECIES: YoaK family protein [Lentilactobacillus]|nr:MULTISPECIES: YoaK family protein [Lentilactobacillus]
MMNKITIQTSILTMSQTLFMGMIDAYTFNTFNGTFASAQTGNLVIFGIALVKEGFQKASIHIPVFAGFLVGAIFAQLIRKYLKKSLEISPLNQLRFFTVISIVISGIILLIEEALPSATSLLLITLGFFASYELTIFNHIGKTSVNNGIMTGNIKNFGNLISDFIQNPQKEIGFKICHYGINIIIFICGVIVGTFYLSQLAESIMLTGILLNSVILLGLLITKDPAPQETVNNQ